MEIEPEKIIQEGQVFTGETEVTVKTDKFLVEDVTVFEEPALEGQGLPRGADQDGRVRPVPKGREDPR